MSSPVPPLPGPLFAGALPPTLELPSPSAGLSDICYADDSELFSYLWSTAAVRAHLG